MTPGTSYKWFKNINSFTIYNKTMKQVQLIFPFYRSEVKYVACDLTVKCQNIYSPAFNCIYMDLLQEQRRLGTWDFLGRWGSVCRSSSKREGGRSQCVDCLKALLDAGENSQLLLKNIPAQYNKGGLRKFCYHQGAVSDLDVVSVCGRMKSLSRVASRAIR